MNFKNINALVSGGCSGLGLATSNLIINNGGKVVAFDLNNQNVDKAMSNHDDYFFISNDVSDHNKTKENVAHAFDKLR